MKGTTRQLIVHKSLFAKALSRCQTSFIKVLNFGVFWNTFLLIYFQGLFGTLMPSVLHLLYYTVLSILSIRGLLVTSRGSQLHCTQQVPVVCSQLVTSRGSQLHCTQQVPVVCCQLVTSRGSQLPCTYIAITCGLQSTSHQQGQLATLYVVRSTQQLPAV